MGQSSLPAKVTIYATPCHHFVSFFLLFWESKESLGTFVGWRRKPTNAAQGAFELGHSNHLWQRQKKWWWTSGGTSPCPLQSALRGQMLRLWMHTNTWVWCWTINWSGPQAWRQSTRKAWASFTSWGGSSPSILPPDAPDVLSVCCCEHHLLRCGVLGCGHQGEGRTPTK